MWDLATQDEQALRGRLGLARERLDRLARDLHAVDRDLEDLSSERRRYQLLDEVCGRLEELRELGAADLFWDGGATRGGGDEHVRTVRGRVDGFQKRLDEIETRREEILDEIERAQDDAELLEDDLFELHRQAELRKLEWVVERETGDLPLRESLMPWTRGREEDRRFRKTLAISFGASLLLGLLLPMIELPLPEAWQATLVPDRLTRLIGEERPLPPPTPVRQETVPEETEAEATEELLAEEPAPKSTPEKPKPKAETKAKGILAFREKFSSLAENEPAARLGAQARITNEGAAPGRAGRSMVTTQAAGSSGGIDLAALSRDVGGGGDGMERVQVARATSSIGAGGGSDRPLSGGPGLGRTDEEIQIVFDRHKAALYRLYNRELRVDPTLEGQIVLRMRIEPDGSVSLCELESSDMDAPQLAAQVVERVKTFDFGAKEGVPPLTILYPIDFLPAI